MAKYYIDYTCGHDGCREVQLGGPHKERERKLEWLRSECLCPDCYRAQKQAETKALGIVARVQAAPSAQPAIIISLHGDTKPCKEDIKARGYSWGDLPAGICLAACGVCALVGLVDRCRRRGGPAREKSVPSPDSMRAVF